MNTQHLRGAAGAIAIEDTGWEGVPLVAVHGAGGNASQWNPLARAVRPRRFITIDLRGHGRSDLPADGRFDVEALAADVAAVVRALGLAQPVLVGHGLGAAVALEAAPAVGASAVCLVAPDAPDVPPEGDPVRARIERERSRTPARSLEAIARAREGWRIEQAMARYGGSIRHVPTDSGAWVHLTAPERVLAALREP